MPLNNSQYGELIREYEARQLNNQRILEDRRKEAYQKVPRLKEIEQAIASCSVRQAAKLLDGDEAALSELKAQIAAYRAEKKELLTASGFPADYFAPVYTCKDCKDTGYIGSNRCHCFKQAAIDLVYTQSNLKDVLATENFKHFSFDFYSKEETDSATGMTSYDAARNAYDKCHDFIRHFDDRGEAGNLCFYGNTGIGKTFLSNCIAKELMDTGHSVIYFTAFQLFDILSKGVFEKDEDALITHRNIFDCDLLIIDDLGTEFANSFTTSQLFLCLNERILRNKSTIISTNLGLNQIADLYSERVFSRITSRYALIKLFGADIRILKKTMPQKRIH
jgi:DNA replication protein DnaC